MSDGSHKTHTEFVIPANVVSRRDISRLVNEVERIDNQMTADSVRSEIGAANGEAIAYSEQLTRFLGENELNLSDSHDRTQLISELRQLKSSAPVVHMTFATVADPESLQEMVQWIRSSAHPQAVIDAALQPALVAGVYIRTPNHIYDFSMRAALKNQRGVLVNELEASRGNS